MLQEQEKSLITYLILVTWHIRSPLASCTSKTPMSFPLNVCPSPINLLSAKPCCPETPVAVAVAPPVAPLEVLLLVRPETL